MGIKVAVNDPSENRKQFRSLKCHYFRYDESDTETWSKYKLDFVANGDEEYLIFGAFPKIKNNLAANELDDVHYVGYFLDDFYLVEYKDSLFFQSLPQIGELSILKGIDYSTNELQIQQECYKQLDLLIADLNRNPEVLIEVCAHTDGIGDENENLEISKRRAEEIKIYLLDLGIGSERIKTKGLGGSTPIKGNKNEFQRRFNRRVEIRIIK